MYNAKFIVNGLEFVRLFSLYYSFVTKCVFIFTENDIELVAENDKVFIISTVKVDVLAIEKGSVRTIISSHADFLSNATGIS